MKADYYKTLQINRNAKDDDLRKAYRRLAMKWHPDKNPRNKKEAEDKFKEISEAYDVLSDPQKRAIYDQFGEEGLNGQVPPSAGGAGAGGATAGEFREFRFNPRNADEIFSEFFGFSNSFSSGDAGGSRGGFGSGSRFSRSGLFGEDIFGAFGGRGSGGGGAEASVRKSPQAQVERALVCSLEDLYNGTTKKMKISRDAIDESGKRTTVEEILTIDIKPGWKKGTKITFPEKGSFQRNMLPADLVFIIDERRHGVFKREGNDLIFTQKISLLEALTGFTMQLTTLDGRNLTIPISSIVSPNSEEIVHNEGMPIAKEPSKKGNLRIRFQIMFPSRLTPDQKAGIRELLAP